MRLPSAVCGALVLALLTAPSPAAVAAPCPPEIVDLPGLPGASATRVSAMNDAGWVAGTSTVDGKDRITLWRNGRAPLDLGSSIRKVKHGNRQVLEPTAVNDEGVVLMTKVTEHYRPQSRTWRTIGRSGVLWQHWTTTQVKGTRAKPWADVLSMNDHGVVVGYVSEKEYYPTGSVPVVWRQGRLSRLPLPRGVGAGAAQDVNNHGLVVGTTGGTARAWWWRLGGGHGALRQDGDVRDRIRNGRFVDDQDRILGWRPTQVVWLGTKARPAFAHLTYEVSALTDRGRYITGREQEDREGEQDNHAWIGRLRGASAALPFPGDSGILSGMPAIGRGVTAYAPEGGVTVGGTLYDESGTETRAVLWTCAQTYLP